MIHWKRAGFFFLAFIFVPVLASAWEKPNGHLNLKDALMVDMDSGKILYQQNADKLIQPASLSKILALYVVNEDIRAGRANLYDMVTISAKAVDTAGSEMFH
jgi:D-alanyl-D-alanine carboxypeptidase (penicillin-binding protein 5/6)